MMQKLNIKSVNDLQAIQRLACQVDEEVFIHSEDGSIMVDAKSFIGLFTLDFTKPVNIVTESQFVIDKIAKLG